MLGSREYFFFFNFAQNNDYQGSEQMAPFIIKRSVCSLNLHTPSEKCPWEVQSNSTSNAILK